MLPKAARLWALLCFFLVLQLATAQSFSLARRQDSDAPATTATESDPGQDGADNTSAESTAVETDAPESTSDSDATASTTDGPTTSETKAPAPTSTIITTDGQLDNSTLKNVTIPEGELPIHPEITPGWAVAGVFLLGSGIVYALIGIKNQWVHTFLSTAYLVALAVTVLIVYVMSVPVSNAVQGGYVVAAVLSGCAIGAGSLVFKELTEGLGCALGGFCVSMWLLCLVPGGLLHPVASKAIFIACFSLVGFAFYFSRWTRDWALIIMISFAGGTVTVLGIDCFSRAGLKEFWAYVWAVNENLFPFGTQTYPVTKGIRVETAAVIIIFLFGIISQIKLWRVVREKKEKRAAQRAEAQRDLEKEEEDLGRQLEENNARERREWERAYGDGDFGSSTVSRNSAGADARSEKGLTGNRGKTSVEVIEMTNLSESSSREPDRLMAAGQGEEGKVMVRVAADDVPGGVTHEDEPRDCVAASIAGSTKEVSESNRVSRDVSVTQAPEVVPLPFTVPADDEIRSQGDRSSVATFADDEGFGAAAPTKRQSFTKRLSQNSASLLRSMSPRSPKSPVTPSEYEGGESAEDLVSPTMPHHDGDNGSVAATLDDDSLSGSERHSVTSPTAKSIEINAELSKRDGKQAEPEQADATPGAGQPKAQTKDPRPVSNVTVSTDILNETDAGTNGTSQVPETVVAPGSTTRSKAETGEDTPPDPSEKPKSTTSSGSNPASLTKERLPRSLSRIAMSYRTNEWAKHLSQADAPEPDEIRIAEAAKPTKSTREKPAPVMIEELQKTAGDAEPEPAPAPASTSAPVAVKRSDPQTSQVAPDAVKRSDSQASRASAAPTAVKRSDSQASVASASRTLPKSASMQGLRPNGTALGGASQEANPLERSAPTPPNGPGMLRSTSSMALRRTSSGFQPIVEEDDATGAGEPIFEGKETEPAPTSPGQDQTEAAQRAPAPGLVSYNSPQTLLGQRDMFLRNKSQGNLISPTPEPTPLSPSSSDAGSLVNYPMYAAALPADADDMPLSQRKQLMRSSSAMSLASSYQGNQGPQQRGSTLDQTQRGSMMDLAQRSSTMDLGQRSSVMDLSANFNSHQPRRASAVMTPAARESQLANFRNSVAADLRSGSPMMGTSGRETPFASTTALLGGSRDVEVQRSIEAQRSALMGQKEAEAQRREVQRREREWANRAFDERMRSGDLLDAHREALRRMQKGARDS